MPTPDDLNEELKRLGRLLSEAQTELVQKVQAYAEAERAYRKERGQAYLQATGTVEARKAEVDWTTADLKYRSLLADGLSRAALEAVRNIRAQISALQTISGNEKELARMARTGPEPDWTPEFR